MPEVMTFELTEDQKAAVDRGVAEAIPQEDGGYAILYFMDADYEPTTKNKAVHGEAIVYDSVGEETIREYVSFTSGADTDEE